MLRWVEEYMEKDDARFVARVLNPQEREAYLKTATRSRARLSLTGTFMVVLVIIACLFDPTSIEIMILPLFLLLILMDIEGRIKMIKAVTAFCPPAEEGEPVTDQISE